MIVVRTHVAAEAICDVFDMFDVLFIITL